jgi:hypothetical protein
MRLRPLLLLLLLAVMLLAVLLLAVAVIRGGPRSAQGRELRISRGVAGAETAAQSMNAAAAAVGGQMIVAQMDAALGAASAQTAQELMVSWETSWSPSSQDSQRAILVALHETRALSHRVCSLTHIA